MKKPFLLLFLIPIALMSIFVFTLEGESSYSTTLPDASPEQREVAEAARHTYERIFIPSDWRVLGKPEYFISNSESTFAFYSITYATDPLTLEQLETIFKETGLAQENLASGSCERSLDSKRSECRVYWNAGKMSLSVTMLYRAQSVGGEVEVKARASAY